jgi:hypothetical protein
MTYETPKITELGAVADLTRADWLAPGSDGSHWLIEAVTGTYPNGGTTS